MVDNGTVKSLLPYYRTSIYRTIVTWGPCRYVAILDCLDIEYGLNRKREWTLQPRKW